MQIYHSTHSRRISPPEFSGIFRAAWERLLHGWSRTQCQNIRCPDSGGSGRTPINCRTVAVTS